MIELGLNSKPPAFPPLERVLNREGLLMNLAGGYVRQAPHPDQKTYIYTYNSARCLLDEHWNQITTLCNGLVVREGKLIARPFPKFFTLRTKGFPETWPENFPPDPEITDMLDGQLLIVYPGNTGAYCVATTDSFGGAALYATTLYHRLYKNAVWPTGYTAMIVAVGPSWPRVHEYPKDELVLVALVRNSDGEELPYGEMADWAEHNKMPVVEYWPYGVERAFAERREMHKGFVFRWLLNGGAPLRVGMESQEYVDHRKALYTLPAQIWDMMRKGESLEALKDPALPVGFRHWVEHWETILRTERNALVSAAVHRFESLGLKPNLTDAARKAAIAAIGQHIRPEDGNTYAMLIAMVDGRKPDEYAWNIARRCVIGVPGWRK